MVERPAAEQHIQWRAPQRARRAARDTLRQKPSRAARARSPTGGMTVRQHRRVHGAGRRRDAVDAHQLLQQAIEHAPGEGARAAALQRQVDQYGVACHASLEVVRSQLGLLETRCPAVRPRAPIAGSSPICPAVPRSYCWPRCRPLPMWRMSGEGHDHAVQGNEVAQARNTAVRCGHHHVPRGPHLRHAAPAPLELWHTYAPPELSAEELDQAD